MSTMKYVNLITLCLALLTPGLFAQSILQGTVMDNGGEYLGSGAEPVVNALVTVTDQTDTSCSFSALTDDEGRYSMEIPQSGVDDNYSKNSAASLRLFQNYPNPFNSATIIAYELARPAHVTIDVYNISGRKVKTLLDGFQNSSGQVTWDATNRIRQIVPDGLYICCLKVGEREISRKMLLIDGHQNSIQASAVSSPAVEDYSAPVLYKKQMADQYTLKVTGENIATYTQTDLGITADTTIDITVYRTVTDVDSNVYLTVKIGDQWWMAENLKVTHYRDGTPIPNVTDSTTWGDLSTGAYCEYNNDPSNVPTYGRLYNWYAVDDPHGLAPVGWHVPTDEEFKTLEMHLGMSAAEANGTGWRGTDQGSQLADSAGLWYDGDLDSDPAFGASGFAALPGGYRYRSGTFYDMTYNAFFWSSAEYSTTFAWDRTLYYDNAGVLRYDYDKADGLSVRFVRDE